MSFAELAQVVDVPEAAVPAPLLCDMINQSYSRRDVNKWYAQLDKRLDSVPTSTDFFSKPPSIQLRDMDDEESVIALREYYTSAERLRAGKLSNLKMNEADLRKMLFERLCSADLDRRLIQDLEAERDELREYNSSISMERNRLKRDLTGLQVRLSKYEGEVMNQRRRDDENRRQQQEQAKKLMKNRETMKTIDAYLNLPPAPNNTGRVAALTAIYSSDENKPLAAASSKSKQYVRGPGGQYNPAVGLVGRAGGKGFANNRYGKPHRRSRSLGGRVLSHQPANKIPTGTVFQPDFPIGTKHTVKVKPEDFKGRTDYVITNQEVDESGNLSTQHYKGDIVPTAGGGHAVMFRDVERLTQESP